MSERSNTQGKFTVEFEAADILIMADALSIASATAMMCGSKAADKRLRDLCDLFRKFSPLPKTNRSEGYAWFAACRSLRDAKFYEAFVPPAKRWERSDKATIIIDVDGKLYDVCEDVTREDAEAHLEKVDQFLAEISGFDTLKIAPVTVKALLPSGDDRYDDEKRRKAAKAVLDAVLGEAGIVYSLRETKDTWDMRGDSCVAEMRVSVPVDMKETVVALMEAAMEAEMNSSPAPVKF